MLNETRVSESESIDGRKSATPNYNNTQRAAYCHAAEHSTPARIHVHNSAASYALLTQRPCQRNGKFTTTVECPWGRPKIPSFEIRGLHSLNWPITILVYAMC